MGKIHGSYQRPRAHTLAVKGGKLYRNQVVIPLTVE